MAALVGGGQHARPGEISLAHNGVLFLDELPEFQGQALDALRQPLETGEVAIARANHRCVYPARFQLIAAMNPCRCGHAQEPGYSCRRGDPKHCAQAYQTRLSGPLLDRIDLHLEVAAVRASDLILPPPTEGSAEVAQRVAAARAIQRERFLRLDQKDISCNAAAPAALVEQIVRLDDAGTKLVRDASERLRLSARGFHRVLKLARTIADLQSSANVMRPHLAEALSYRAPSDRNHRAA
jgi:magnesium chelatase family protein